MKSKTFVIIILGPSCTGKSTLANKIAEEFHFPVISKDEIKEFLFDTVGWSDREWSKKLGAASLGIMYKFIKKFLQTGKPFIVESTFYHEIDTEKFLDLKKEFDFEPIQINCKCEGEILFNRFKERSERGARHPGHVDNNNYDEYKDMLLEGGWEPLEIGGQVFDFDSTDLEKLDYNNVFEKIRTAINNT